MKAAIIVNVFYVCFYCVWGDMGKPLSIRLHASRKALTYHGEVTMTCEVESKSGRPLVTWQRGAEVFDPDSDWATLQRDLTEEPQNDPPLYTTILNVVNVTLNHTYTCLATVGISTVSASISIHVGPKPKVYLIVRPEQAQYRGRNVTMTCEVKSAIEAEVSWQDQPGHRVIEKGILPLVTTRTPNGEWNYTLVLNLFPVKRNGTYTCYAKNLYGSKGLTWIMGTLTAPFGGRCKVHLDCSTAGAHCNKSEMCYCTTEQPVYVKARDGCYPGVEFGKECTFSSQCHNMDDLTECTSSGFCRCVGDTIYSMDRKTCFHAEGEPNSFEVIASLGGVLGFVVVADMVVYFLMKKSDKGKSNTSPEEKKTEDEKVDDVLILEKVQSSSGGESSDSDWESRRKTPSLSEKPRYMNGSCSTSVASAQIHATQGSPSGLLYHRHQPLRETKSLTGPYPKEKSVSLEIIRGRKPDESSPVRVTRGQSERLKIPENHIRTHSF